MLIIRRSSINRLKASGLNIAAFRACAGRGSVSCHKEDKSSPSKRRLFSADIWITSKACNCIVFPKQFSVRFRYLSSQAGANSSGEEDDDLEGDDFPELDTAEVTETAGTVLVDDDSASSSTSDSGSKSDVWSCDTGLDETLTPEVTKAAEAGHLHDESTSVSLCEPGSDLPSFDAGWEGTLETLLRGEIGEEISEPSALFRLVMEEPGSSIPGALDKYVEGKELSRAEVYHALLKLHRHRLLEKALQLSDWLEGREDFDFWDQDYASRVYLIAKVRGLDKAEIYFNSIPESFREEEVVYRSLLVNYVSKKLVNKAEQLFNKMKDLGLPITVFTCNRMLLLYMRTDMRKIGEMLVMMEKENIKPSRFTYQMLIDAKGKLGDIKGMEKVIEMMNANGVDPNMSNIHVQAVVARHYASAGLKEKAEVALKEINVKDLKSARFIFPIILPIHASLRNVEEVLRIWKIIESKPQEANFLAAIEAFGKLKNIEMAEYVFDKMTKTFKNLSTKHYNKLLNVYADNKMVSKGKELIKRMGEAGVTIGPVACDAIVRLYVNVGEVETADSVLQKVVLENPRVTPLFRSYMYILIQYSKRGDIHNAERIFQRMRMAGYIGRPTPFIALLRTYINAKVPAYGIRERMKADKVRLNNDLTNLMALVELQMDV